MTWVPHNHFDGPVAETYDARSAAMFDPAVVVPAVDVLADLAGTGRALELAVGTGRLALPLSERGVEVHGIELSAAMVEQLRAKPGGERITVTLGDMTTTRLPARFAVAYLVFNTITNLTTQDAQVECFRNAAAHLEPGGCFVIECFVPQLRRLPPGESVQPFDVSPNHLGFDEYDVVAQIAVSHHYWIGDGEVDASSTPFRYVWPSELDLMARLAGLTLRDRWDDWTRAPFTADSRSHVSVWQKPPASDALG
jgi:SAM-dependent methyltransferase